MGTLTINPVAESFLACLARARHVTEPFDFWLLDGALPEEDIDAISSLPSPLLPTWSSTAGARPTTPHACISAPRHGKPIRCAVVWSTASRTRASSPANAKGTGTKLAGTRLGSSIARTSPGSWLEPHTDIAVKKFTMLVYMLDDPALKVGRHRHPRRTARLLRT